MLAALLTLALSQAPCPRGWDALPGDACLLRGERPGVVVYLHGMMAPSPRPFAWELGFISTAAARRPHPPVVVVRGAPGLCDWSTEYVTWWCWPSVRSRSAEGLAALGRVSAALDGAGKLLGSELPPPLFVGYSNGGYFLTQLMGELPAPATGYVVMHAGPVKGVPFPLERRRPTLLLAAAGDLIQRPAMESLRATLEASGWRPAWGLRQGAHPPELEDYTRVFDFAAGLSWSPEGTR